MSRKILFLDIDGVLNSRNYMNSVGRGDAIDPRCVLHLNEAIRRTGCKVVVSSAWRNLHTWAELLSILEDHGVNTEVFIDKTPDRFREFKNRDDEISEWLDNHGQEGDQWCIIDDELEHLVKLKDRLVKTSFQEKGMTKEHEDAVVRFLGELQ